MAASPLWLSTSSFLPEAGHLQCRRAHTHTTMHARTQTCVCMHTQRQMCVHAYVHVCACMNMYCTQACTYVCEHTQAHMCIHAHKHKRACAHTHTHLARVFGGGCWLAFRSPGMPRKACAHPPPPVASVGQDWQPFWAPLIPKCHSATHHFPPSVRPFSPRTVHLPQTDIQPISVTATSVTILVPRPD